ncbi:FAD-dependent oxidoreductase [Nitrosophilus kaiyonis]|uniref:FAD-dependent oxidoreductase n=1 Tax=Nitrosophilus kaiyonis TaxID=2930200 RepID=UPI0024921F95|nr:FAD-dependent oxidoreductase [Nitrosophilus kaiyonis]
MVYDLLIIGSGGAGLSAALKAKELGLKCIVINKNYPTTAQTSMAQGGINAVLDSKNDSIYKHIEDTLKSSQGLADKKVVEYVCNEAPKIIEWLDSIGVPFSRKDKKIAQRKLGGASGKRACYVQDYTGLKILHTLYDNAIKENIEFKNDYFLLNLIVENGSVYGATFLDKKNTKVEQILSKSVILATGGYAKIYDKFSTNSSSATGDGIAAAIRAGCKLSDLEFIQFHPTSLKNSSILISEAARGAGGKLINQKGERFIDEMLTRDEIARAIYKEIEKGNEVFLDIRHLGEEFIEENLPQERKLAIIYEGVDSVKDLIPIKPAAHYTMGGIDVDFDLKTNIDGLFAVGECANAKLHGANRLGGNSLLEVITLGIKAAKNAYKYKDRDIEDKIYEKTVIDSHFIKSVFSFENKIDFYEKREFLSKIFYANVGVFRNEMGLKGVLSAVRQMQRELLFMGISDKSTVYNTNLIDFIEFGNMLELSEAILVGAISRNESRGAHFREDFPNRDDENFLAHTVIWKEDGVICADFKKVK